MNPAFDADEGGGHGTATSTIDTSPSAAVIARAPTMRGLPAVFAFASGQPMTDGFVAPAARVGLGIDVDASGTLPSTGNLSAEGQAIFVAAVEWALP